MKKKKLEFGDYWTLLLKINVVCLGEKNKANVCKCWNTG